MLIYFPIKTVLLVSVCLPSLSYGDTEGFNSGCSKGAEMFAKPYARLVRVVVEFIKNDPKANVKDIERDIRELHEKGLDELFYSQKEEQRNWEEKYKQEAPALKSRMMTYLFSYHSSIKLAHNIYLSETFKAINNLAPITESRILRIVEEECKLIVLKSGSK